MPVVSIIEKRISDNVALRDECDMFSENWNKYQAVIKELNFTLNLIKQCQ